MHDKHIVAGLVLVIILLVLVIQNERAVTNAGDVRPSRPVLTDPFVSKKTPDWSELSREFTVRDFNRYPCRDRRRVGGHERFLRHTNDSLYRIDGAWFVCFDAHLAPQAHACTVFSFGIRDDETFDREMNLKYGCQVYSFDPFGESPRFMQIRQENPSMNGYHLKINHKWDFYRLGIQGERSNVQIPGGLRMQSMINYDEMLELTGQKNKVVDIFKMDIEDSEKGVLEHLDMDYMCKYVKQFMLEIHIKHRKIARELMSRLERCFYLFHRDTRFYMHEGDGPTGYMSEFQLRGNVAIEIRHFQDDLDMVDFIFNMGELYFVNLNFLNQD
jgi:hypothetical protein